MAKKPRIPRVESPEALARKFRNDRRRELYAINKERKLERRELFKELPQPAEELSSSGAFRPGGTNQSWDPDHWIYDGKIPLDTFATGVRGNITGRNIRLSYRIVAPSMKGYGKSEEGGDVIDVGQVGGKMSFLRRLEQGQSLARIVEEVRGWPRGTVERVLEVSIAESSQ